MSLLLELWPMAKLVVKQSAKPHGHLVLFPFYVSFLRHVDFRDGHPTPFYKVLLALAIKGSGQF